MLFSSFHLRPQLIKPDIKDNIKMYELDISNKCSLLWKQKLLKIIDRLTICVNCLLQSIYYHWGFLSGTSKFSFIVLQEVSADYIKLVQKSDCWWTSVTCLKWINKIKWPRLLNKIYGFCNSTDDNLIHNGL